MRSVEYKDADGSRIKIACRYVDDCAHVSITEGDWSSGEAAISIARFDEVLNGRGRKSSQGVGDSGTKGHKGLECNIWPESKTFEWDGRVARMSQEDFADLHQKIVDYKAEIDRIRTGTLTGQED